VDYVVEGSVRHSDGRLRITAQLISVRDETHVWAEAYERALSDVLRIQVDVAQAIGQRLSIRLLTPASPAQTAQTVSSPEAAAAYLKGVHFAARRSEEDLQRAVELFRKAIELEPGNAAAHAALAGAYASLASSADAIPAREARALAEASGRRALELDPELPAAHASLAVLRCRFDWDWAQCESGLMRLLALAPNDAHAHHWLGEYLMQRGRLDEAAATFERARALDPLSASTHTHVGLVHMYGRRYERALPAFEEALEIDPGFLLARRARGLSLVRSGRVEDGLAALREARARSPRSARAAADLGHALGIAGRHKEARAILDELMDLARERHVSAYDFAMVCAGLGETTTALEWLEKGYAEGATGIRWLKVETAFDPLRGEPRFAALLRGIGLPD
jgi:tetratricopeptide (TPR) repeat protein